MKRVGIAGGVLICTLSGGVVDAAPKVDERPNIVVIMTDDSGYTDLGCYGGEIDTPNIDKLSTEGVKFSSFYTNGRCSPTRASFMTGLDSGRVGFGGGVVGDWWREMPYKAHRGRLPYEQPTVAELLHDNGYHTMMVGKWHLGGSLMKEQKGLQRAWKKYHKKKHGWKLTKEEIEAEYNAMPAQRGFDEYFGLTSAEGNLFITPDDNHHYLDGNKKAKLEFKDSYNMHCYVNPKYARHEYKKHHGKSGKAFYATDGVTDRAVDMIKKASGNKKKPFFMFVSYRAPHVPLQAPEELVQKYLSRYDDLEEVVEARREGLIEKGMFTEESSIRRKGWLWGSMNEKREKQYKRMAAVHASMMEKVDDNVGRLIKTLKQKGEYDNTLILYFSDNGAASHIGDLMNAPYHGSKALLWEGGTRAHCIATWPKIIKPGTISDSVVWVGDLMPTFLDISKSKFPKKYHGKKTLSLDGRSVTDALKGEKMSPPDKLFFNDKGQQSIVFKGRWKLLIEPGWYNQTRKKEGIAYELYDLDQDPGETTNLASKKPEMVKQLLKECDQWKSDVDIKDYSEILKIRPKDLF